MYVKYNNNAENVVSIVHEFYGDEAKYLSDINVILNTYEQKPRVSERFANERFGFSAQYKDVLGYKSDYAYVDVDTNYQIVIRRLKDGQSIDSFYKEYDERLLENKWKLFKIINENLPEGIAMIRMFNSSEKKETLVEYYKYGLDKSFFVGRLFSLKPHKYEDNILYSLNSITIDTIKDGTLFYKEYACALDYKNGYCNEKEREIKYNDGTIFTLIAKKIASGENENAYVQRRIRELKTLNQWEFKSSDTVSYENCSYLRLQLEYGNRQLEKYILLPILRDENVVYEINHIYNKGKIGLTEERDYILNSFRLLKKTTGEIKYGDVMAGYIDANYVEDRVVYYPFSTSFSLNSETKIESETLEQFLKRTEEKWVNEWNFEIIEKAVPFEIGENQYYKYKLKTNGRNSYREYYIHKDENKKFYYIKVFYNEDNIYKVLDKLMYFLMTFKVIK